jgi:hypothetical protein
LFGTPVPPLYAPKALPDARIITAVNDRINVALVLIPLSFKIVLSNLLHNNKTIALYLSSYDIQERYCLMLHLVKASNP